MSDYEKTTWVDDETPVDAEHLNHMEGGIEGAQSTANSVKDSIPTKTSELTNDSGFITDSALEDYAKESDVEAVKETADSALETATETKEAIPTKVSQLDNDIPYATESAVNQAQTSADTARAVASTANVTANSALETANAVAESAITGINVNGTEQPVNDNIAELTISAGVAYASCDSDADEEYKDIGTAVPGTSVIDGFALAVLFTKGNTLEEILIGGDSLSERSTVGDARCPENSVVFFVYSDSAFIVDAGLTKANSAITSITVNGEDVPVENNTAEITVSGAEPTVEDETLIF